MTPDCTTVTLEQLSAAGLVPTLHERRIAALPFAADSFDAVLCAHALEHVADLPATIAELARVLRPGAPLLLVVSRPGPATAWLGLRWDAATYPRHDPDRHERRRPDRPALELCVHWSETRFGVAGFKA